MSDQQRIAFLFPGQGSQAVGMGQDLAEQFPIARRTFQEADERLRFPLSHLMVHGPEQDLNDTLNAQPALYVHSIAVLRILEEQHPGLQPACVAGHSLGELSALTAAGALSFMDGLTLVRRRGELMKQAGEHTPGGMAAIIGLDIPTLERVCAEACREGEVVQVANDNCPGQVVLSGARPALERALDLAKQAGARRAVALAVSIAAHSPLMASIQTEFTRAVAGASISDPKIAVIGNVTAAALEDAAALRQDLVDQLTSRVRWTESVLAMRASGVDTFFELGSGSVLTGLLKRIDAQATGRTLGSAEDLSVTLDP